MIIIIDVMAPVAGFFAMVIKKVGRPRETPKENFSVRLPPEDVKRIKALAAAHEWPLAKVIQKLVKAALDARVLK
jgi:hypothetical protein